MAGYYSDVWMNEYLACVWLLNHHLILVLDSEKRQIKVVIHFPISPYLIRPSTRREDGTEDRRRDVKPSCDTTTYGLFINQLNQAASRSKDA